jgi:hypothetical protein
LWFKKMFSLYRKNLSIRIDNILSIKNNLFHIYKYMTFNLKIQNY